jgi:hypothetical protein
VSGEWDGIGVVLKRRLKWEQLQNPKRKLQCAKEVVSFIEKILFTQVFTLYTQNTPNILRKFRYITIDDIDRSNPFGCDTILGS